MRFELYVREKADSQFRLTFEAFTPATLRNFETFLQEEHEIFSQFPQIYKAVPLVHKTKKSVKPEQRSQNTINGILVKVRTFFIWSIDNGKTTNNPFRKFKITESVFGTPYYLTVSEIMKLFNADFSDSPQLAIHRDIFIFQSMVGCRVGDLFKLTKANIITGAVEYIAQKTTNGNPVTVRVPLNSIALQILGQYKDYEGPGLFPFVVVQRFNEYVRLMLEKAEITRTVTILDPLTRKADHKPINEVATSHLARRSFIGNLYKAVKDPNLVGALSGHKEGSRAFARYRTIDEEMKTDLVKMLE